MENGKWNVGILDWNCSLPADFSNTHQNIVLTFRHFGVTPPSIEKFREFLGTTGCDFLTGYRRLGLPHSITTEELNELRIKHLTKDLPFAELYPGAVEFLEHCRQNNIFIAIVSGEIGEIFKKHVSALGLWSFIDYFVADVRDKEHEFRKILEMCDYPPEKIFCIDDMPAGIEAANKFKIYSIAFTSGLGTLPQLTNAKPCCFAGSYTIAFEKLFGGKLSQARE